MARGGSNPRAVWRTPAATDPPEAAWPVRCHTRAGSGPDIRGAREAKQISHPAALHCRRDHRKREPKRFDGGVTKLATVEGLNPSVRKDLQVRILPPPPLSPAAPSTPVLVAAAQAADGPPPAGRDLIESVTIGDAAEIMSASSDEEANRAR